MASARKKDGYPSEELALSATSVLSFSRISRVLREVTPGECSYLTEFYLAKLIFDFRYFMEVCYCDFAYFTPNAQSFPKSGTSR